MATLLLRAKARCLPRQQADAADSRPPPHRGRHPVTTCVQVRRAPKATITTQLRLSASFVARRGGPKTRRRGRLDEPPAKDALWGGEGGPATTPPKCLAALHRLALDPNRSRSEPGGRGLLQLELQLTNARLRHRQRLGQRTDGVQEVLGLGWVHAKLIHHR
jgi:hypothetical protein